MAHACFTDTSAVECRFSAGFLTTVISSIALMLTLSSVGFAANYAVNSTDDIADINIGDGICDADSAAATVCTLRAAINEANADTALDVVTVPAGVFILDIPRAGNGSANDGDGETGDLDIDRDIEIAGAGPGRTIVSGAGFLGEDTDRIFHFRGASTDVNLRGLTLEGGRYGGTGGAAIHNAAGGRINVENILVRDISAGASGPITNQGSGAGSAVNVMRISNTSIITSYGSNTSAIQQDYSGTRLRTLELINVTVASTSHGSFPNNRNGTIRIDKGEANLSHVTLFNNRYGLDVENAVVTVSNSLFVDNGDDTTGRNCRTDIQPVGADGSPSGAVIAGGTITSLGGNFSSDGTCSYFNLPSDTNGGGNPGLADLVGRSGTVVVPFYSGNEILQSAACEPFDQIGTARGGTCVVGAYEQTIQSPQVISSPGLTPGTVSGVVFRDYNDNGQRDPGEPAVPNVRVSAYANSTSALDSTLSDINGQYSLATGTTTVRIEFTNIPSWLEPGAVGTESDTTIQFVETPAADINLALFNPGQFCQNDPQMATSCYLIGDQAGYLAEDTVVGFNYSDGSGSRSDGSVIGENGFGGSGNPNGPWAYNDPAPAHLATGSAVGSTWGMAYHRSSGDLFVAAFHKRHAGQGPDGPGAIYRVDPSGATAASTLIVLGDVATDPHATNAGDWALDADAWNAVGRASLGDMDISDDDSTLFVINLETRTLDVIDISGATRTGQVPIPDTLPGANTGCVASDVMPFAVGHNDGITYIGLVCSATSTQNANDLHAYVYSYNGTNFSIAPVLEFTLNYPRGESYGGDSYALSADWKPWTPLAATYSGQIPSGYFDQEITAGGKDTIRAAYAQPMLADIEFDNGDMVLAIMDRTGHQQANRQRLPDGGSFTDADPAGPIVRVDNVEAAGDLLRACQDGAGRWIIETNAGCGNVTTAGSNNREGTDGGEYYFEDSFLTAHPEVLMGGLEQVPGKPNIVYVAYDPILWNRDFNSGGIHWASNAFGTWQKGYRLYDTRTGQATFAKANGLGDIEALCELAPIEIGNYVWYDTDKDGLQDPSETPLAGVLVGLFDSIGNLIATVETNADGQYLFSSDSSRVDVNSNSNTLPEFDYAVGGLSPNATYTVAILDSNFAVGGALFGWTPTISDNTLNRRDSDAVTVSVGSGSNAASNGVVLRTGSAGANNHTFDFGFNAPVYDLALIKTLKPGQSAWVVDGDTVAYDIEILNQGNVASDVFSVVDVIPYGMSYVTASGSNFSCNFVSGAPPAIADEVLCVYSPDSVAALAPNASAKLRLVLKVDDLTQAPFRNWAEIEEDSSAKYGVMDGDSTPGDHNATDNGPGSGSNGSNPSVDHNDISHSGSEDYDDSLEDEDDSDPALVRAALTTPITLSSFRATANADKTLTVNFRTSTEEANLGFHIYARTANGWQRLNKTLIATRVIGNSSEGADYRVHFVDTGAREYAISDVDTSGNEIMHGPFKIGRHYGLTSSRRLQSVAEATENHSIDIPVRSTLSLDKVYADVTRAGIHAVSFAQLTKAGVDWRGVAAHEIAVTRNGRPVPRHIRGGRQINRNSVIEFLVPELPENDYSPVTRYLISRDTDSAKSPIPLATVRISSVDQVRTAMTDLDLERNRYYSRLAPGDDPWYMDKLLSLGNSVHASYEFQLTQVARTQAGRLTIDVWGGNDDPAIRREHRIAVTVNGTRVGGERFSGVHTHQVVLTIPNRLLNSGSNRVTVSVRSRSRSHADLVYINALTLRYPRILTDSEPFNFKSSGGETTVQLNNAHDAIVYRQSNGQTLRLYARPRTSGRNVRVSIAENGAPSQTWVSSSADTQRPRLVRTPLGGQLFSEAADYLVITHSRFRTNDLLRLTQAREADGYRIKTVNTGWIYRDYSGGERNADAIKRYIEDAKRRMGVRYVLLVGDDTYDYQNRLKRNQTSFVPSLYAATDERLRHVAVDPLYGDTDNDGVPDVAIGRLPVSTQSQLRKVVNKTLQYARSASRRVVLVSDHRDSASRHSFRADNQRIARILQQRQLSVAIAPADLLGARRTRTRLMGAIDHGARLVNYMGHSDRDRWGFNSLLSTDQLHDFDNASSPTVITQFGCWNNDYTTIGRRTLGENLLLMNENGAAAVIGSTTLSGTRTQARLAMLFYDSVTQPGTTIGDAMIAAKTQLALERGEEKVRDMLLGVVLLGDPAVTPYTQP